MTEKIQCPKKCSIGGQALIEGVMMRGPKKLALAVRHTSGEIRMEYQDNDTAKKPAVYRTPFIRGIFTFIDAMVKGSKCLMRSVELSGYEDGAVEEKKHLSKEENEKRTKTILRILTSLSMVLGVALAVALFIWLPTVFYNYVKTFFPVLNDRVLQAVFEGVLKLIIFLAYVWLVSYMKDIRRVFMYHGAEHKTIFCYEHSLPLTVENVRIQSRFHPRCGTSFIILLLLVGVFVSLFIPHTIPSLLRAGIKILCLPVIMGVGYELLKLAGRKENAFTRIISAPGLWMQRITTQEPDDSMIECAIQAFRSVLPEDEAEYLPPISPPKEGDTALTQDEAARGPEEPELENKE